MTRKGHEQVRILRGRGLVRNCRVHSCVVRCLGCLLSADDEEEVLDALGFRAVWVSILATEPCGARCEKVLAGLSINLLLEMHRHR